MKIINLLMPLALITLIIAAGCSGTNANAGLKIGLCGTHEETYTTNEKGCENMQGCRCIHENFFGACDNCECSREVSDC